MISIRKERPPDIAAREGAARRGFRRTALAQELATAARGRLPADGLAFIAADGERVVGTARLWAITCGTGQTGAAARAAWRSPAIAASAASAARWCATRLTAARRSGHARSHAGRRCFLLRPFWLLGGENRRLAHARPVRAATSACPRTRPRTPSTARADCSRAPGQALSQAKLAPSAA